MPQFPEFPGARAVLSVRTGSRGVVRVTGGDRMAFLTRIMAGQLPPAPGAAPTALLGPKGNVIAAAVATVTSEAVFLECEASREHALLVALDRYRISDDVDLSLADRSDFEIVCTDAAPTPEKPDLASPGWVLETAVGFMRRDFRPWSATTIFHLGVRTGDRVPFRDLMLAEGESVEASPEEQEYLRILAGEPRWEAELHERSLPLQSGLSLPTSASAGAVTSARNTWRARRIGAASRGSSAAWTSRTEESPKRMRWSSSRGLPRVGSQAPPAGRPTGGVRPASPSPSCLPTCPPAPPWRSFAAPPAASPRSERNPASRFVPTGRGHGNAELRDSSVEFHPLQRGVPAN